MLKSVFKNRVATIAFTLAALVPAFVVAANLAKLDRAKSNVTITFTQMNVPVDAKFKSFNAIIDYDAVKPELSKANVEIDLKSFDLGDAQYNQEVLKKEWFNAAQFPKASFVSSSMKQVSAGKLQVAGKLTIKGKTQDVSFPLAISKQGDAFVFDGKLPIKRLTFNIGEGEWKDASMVADEVQIKFHVVAAP
jgi:polyisoprenoid-binding protein YceI